MEERPKCHCDCTVNIDMPTSNTRHKSAVVMLIIDVINHFEFPDGDRLLKQAVRIAPKIARLKLRARRLNMPVVYVNDNFGQWRSDMMRLLQYCLRPEARGRKFVEILRPEVEDYFILKPMHSAFYQSPLEVLLREFGASSLILTGLATDSCIACTAHDAEMRDFRVIVPSDCSAARSLPDHRRAIEHIRKMGHTNVQRSSTLRLSQTT
jgi:nicotinamidase-related amidase